MPSPIKTRVVISLTFLILALSFLVFHWPYQNTQTIPLIHGDLATLFVDGKAYPLPIGDLPLSVIHLILLFSVFYMMFELFGYAITLSVSFTVSLYLGFKILLAFLNGDSHDQLLSDTSFLLQIILLPLIGLGVAHFFRKILKNRWMIVRFFLGGLVSIALLGIVECFKNYNPTLEYGDLLARTVTLGVQLAVLFLFSLPLLPVVLVPFELINGKSDESASHTQTKKSPKKILEPLEEQTFFGLRETLQNKRFTPQPKAEEKITVEGEAEEKKITDAPSPQFDEG